MAEEIARDKFAREKIKNQVISAGLQNINGEPASNNGIIAMKEINLDISDHTSTLVNREIMEEANMVLTMTIAQRDLLRIAYYDIENIDEKVQTFRYTEAQNKR